MSTVFLDFDGVLFDTLKEAYLLCRFAYSGTDYFESIKDSEYRRFFRYKFLVYNSWQYYYVMRLLKDNLSDEEFISQYMNYMENRDITSEQEFDKKYYAGRCYLMEKHPDYWSELETPFPFFYGIKRAYSDNLMLPVIVSKKNKKAIGYRLNQYGLAIPDSKIFGKDELADYETKAEFISDYMKQNNISHSFFVDDNSNNLTPCREYKNISALLAGWGNISIYETGLTPEEILKTIIGDSEVFSA